MVLGRYLLFRYLDPQGMQVAGMWPGFAVGTSGVEGSLRG